MKAKNTFKQAVIKKATEQGVSHPNATRQVEETFRFYPATENEVFEHCGEPLCECGNQTKTEYQPKSYGSKVGEWSFGGNEYGDGNQMWPTKTNDGSIAATAHIQKF